MTWNSLKRVHDGALRGGLCAVWIFGMLMSFTEFLYTETADDVVEHNTYMVRCAIALLCVVLALSAHISLIPKKDGADDGEAK
jgi:hypothetical protein